MKKCSRFFIISFIIMFLSLYGLPIYGDIAIPKTIKVGLNYGSPMYNNINIKSLKPIEITFKKNGKDETILLKAPIDFSFRKDTYFNIVNGEEKKIQYIKAVKYSGDLLGPYHIQIGKAYKNYDLAEVALKSINKSVKGSFVAYEEGWRIWNGLLLDEKEAKEQMNIIQKKLVDTNLEVIEPDEGRIQIVDAATGNPAFIYNCDELLMSPEKSDKGASLIEYKGSRYRGDFIIKALDDGSIGVINSLPLSDYLYGVVPCEMQATWHMEALKAQAVAARNYTLLSIDKHEKDGFDLCNTQHCQVYKGYDSEHPNTNEAVDKTKNKLLYYKNELAQTYYHSSSGGHTDNSENIWSESVPYLRGVDDSYGLGSPYDIWVSQLDKSFIETKLAEYDMNIGSLLNIEPIETSEFGRVIKLEIIGAKDTVVLEKEKCRSVLGSTNIKSIWYELATESDLNIFDMQSNDNIIKRPEGLTVISGSGTKTLTQKDKNIYVKGLFDVRNCGVIPKEYTFTGRGWGHGLGMSQYGAKGMAEEGFNYAEILEHYYKGTRVQ
jgi:stage II sporulation protein D